MNNEFSIVCSSLFGSMKVLARLDTYEAAQLVHKQAPRCSLVQTQFGNTAEVIEESIVFTESKLKARSGVSIGCEIIELIVLIIVLTYTAKVIFGGITNKVKRRTIHEHVE